MAAAALLAARPKPTYSDIDAAMNTNLCRCGTYVRIRQGIHQAVRTGADELAPTAQPATVTPEVAK